MKNKPPQIDLLDPSINKTTHKKTIIIIVVFLIIVGILATIGARASYLAVSHGTNIFNEINHLSFFSSSSSKNNNNPSSSNNKIPQKSENRINILLLGVGGAGHEGSQLTDTIIIGSIDTKKEKFAMLSIPRDLAYPMENKRFRKINNLNAYYELSNPGQGAELTSQDISALLNIHIDYVVKIDFKGFENFINKLDGIDVSIERSFTDRSYPAPNFKYKTISFTKGPMHMTGKTALEFARSRHGNHGEGSDFARSRRQQLVIQAVKDKIFSLDTLSNPNKINNLYNTIADNIQTNISIWDIVQLAKYFKNLNSDNITNRVLTDARDGELVPANINGAYMLFPKKPDWSEIRSIAQNPFISKKEAEKALEPETKTIIQIKNGTNYEGYAFHVSQKLKKLNYTIPKIGNATHRGYSRTIIYDLTNNNKKKELAKLKKILDADIINANPQKIKNSNRLIIYTEDMATEPIEPIGIDFLIILGESSLGLIQPYL